MLSETPKSRFKSSLQAVRVNGDYTDGFRKSAKVGFLAMAPPKSGPQRSSARAVNSEPRTLKTSSWTAFGFCEVDVESKPLWKHLAS